MTAVAPAPGSVEWQRLVTASKVAAILGLSPWDSPRSIWHLLRGEVPSDDGTNQAAKSRGHYLEDGILDWWADQHPELREDSRQPYVTDPALPWAAATPDLIASDSNGNTVVVDAKTARNDDEWGDPGTDEVPAYYAAQLQWQMHLAKAKRGYIALLTNRLDLREFVIDYDAATAVAMENICHDFYQSTLNDDAAPPIDDSVATFQALRKVHPDIDRDAHVELDHATATELVEAHLHLKAAEARDRLARSVVLEQMGRARLAKHNDQTIARRQANRTGVSFVIVAKTPPAKETT